MKVCGGSQWSGGPGPEAPVTTVSLGIQQLLCDSPRVGIVVLTCPTAGRRREQASCVFPNHFLQALLPETGRQSLLCSCRPARVMLTAVCSVDRRMESEESGDEEGKKQSGVLVAELSEHSLKDGVGPGEEDPEGTGHTPLHTQTHTFTATHSHARSDPYPLTPKPNTSILRHTQTYSDHVHPQTHTDPRSHPH